MSEPTYQKVDDYEFRVTALRRYMSAASMEILHLDALLSESNHDGVWRERAAKAIDSLRHLVGGMRLPSGRGEK